MTAYNQVKFELNCSKCQEKCLFYALINSCAYLKPDPKNGDLEGIVYSIGDTMRWKSDSVSNDDWVSEYAYVDPRKEYNVSAIEKCDAYCVKCKKLIFCYILITNRKIIRIIGIESSNFSIFDVINGSDGVCI